MFASVLRAQAMATVSSTCTGIYMCKKNIIIIYFTTCPIKYTWNLSVQVSGTPKNSQETQARFP